MDGWPKITGGRVRWDFEVGYVNDSNLITLLLLWVNFSCISKCIIIMSFHSVSRFSSSRGFL